MVEQLLCKHQVVSSNLTGGSTWLVSMKVIKTKTVTLSLSKEEIREAIVFWLSRGGTKSTTETCTIACYLHNNEPKIKFVKNHLILDFKADDEEQDI